MTTGLNNTEEEHSRPAGGFWNRNVDSVIIPDPGSEPDPEPVPEPAQDAVPDADSTAPLPVIPADAEPIMSQAAGLAADDQDVDATPFESALSDDTATPTPTISSWDEELSWEDDISEDPTDPSGLALSLPEVDVSSHVEIEDTGYLGVETVYDDGEELKSRRMPRLGKNRRTIVIVLVVLVLLGVGYALGVRNYSNRFLPNTQINGFEVADLTVEEATRALEGETANYACTVSVDDFSTTVAGADITIDRDEAAMVDAVFAAQSAYKWPLALIMAPREQVDAQVTFDEEALKKIVTSAVDEYNEKTLPDDKVTIDYNEESGLFEVNGSTKGTAVDAGPTCEAVVADVKEFNTQSAPSASEATHSATVMDIPSYAKTAEYANRSRTSDIPILVNGEEVILSTADQHVEWVKVCEGPAVEVDKDAIRGWAEYSVADAVFHSDDWSDYHLDIDAFVDGFSERLAQGNVDGYEAPTYDELRSEGESREKAYAKGGWDSELGRYIDVDLESQFARLFDEEGNVIWESAFVSGDMYQGHSTVTGTFQIYSMQTNTVLVGLDYNNDGQPDYESFVNYWMPFCGGYGLHDATWRANFGGEVYQYYGSHGCVNLPYSKAEELYGITHVGETVNVHW